MKCIILLWIFPCRKWRKWAKIAILSIWRKLQNRPRILKMLQNSPAKITESDPKLSDFADQSLSRTATYQLGFYWFFDYFDTNLDPIEAQSLTQLPFDINWRIRLRKLKFWGLGAPQNPSSLHSLHPLLFTSHPISSIFHLPSSSMPQ